ncbi:phage minor tail protein L [Piscirickettsia litoralis]|uniref:Phage minor tail protein L n=1 Tax=Piscirickettsia litoralis TaxID=1891921 RepID=A0ABX2ZWQ7_9GAMM|nr:phage minor tail protein L [Piscirickettsia litoralis]ODN41044.1 phage minor tail protein L [Piscirickettsia litoralis]
MSLVESAKIYLYTLDLSPLKTTTKYHFCGSPDGNKSVSFGGVIYNPIPLQTDGFERTTLHQPTPSIVLGNVKPVFLPLLKAYDNLRGALIRRVMTYVKHLDGHSDPDPSATMPEQIYVIERKSQHNNRHIAFELGTKLPTDLKLPRRTQLASCPRVYRQWDEEAQAWIMGDCPYLATKYYNEFGQQTNDKKNDKCGKKLADCMARFGNEQALPFAGFEGIKPF